MTTDNPCGRPEAVAAIAHKLFAELEHIQQARRWVEQSRDRWRGYAIATPIAVDPAAEVALVKSLISEVCRMAEAHLSVGSIKPSCAADDWIAVTLGDEPRQKYQESDSDFHERRRRHWLRFDPLSLWGHLVEHHPRETTTRVGRRLAAAAIRKGLGIRHGQELRQVAGRVEFQIGLSSSVRFGRDTRSYNAYHWASEWKEMRHGFIVYLESDEQSEDDRALLMGVCNALDVIQEHGFEFRPRDKTSISGGGVIHYFKDAVKIQLPVAAVGRLHLFLAEHGATPSS